MKSSFTRLILAAVYTYTICPIAKATDHDAANETRHEAVDLLPTNIELRPIGENSGDATIMLAAKRRAPKRGRAPAKAGKKAAAASHSAAAAPATAGSKGHAKSAIKGSAGLVVGVEGVSDSIFVFGGDYVMPFAMPNLNLQGGASYWYHDTIGELVATRIAVLTLGAGAGYLVHLGKTMWLEAMGKGIFALATTTVTNDDGSGKLTTTEVKDSVPGVALGAGFHYDIGGMDLGPEVWYPIYFDAKAKGITAISALLFFEFHL
jgi:hypothetical protein